MNIDKIKNQIQNLSEEEKQTIEHIEEMNDEEIGKAVGGLSEKAKIALIALGALGVAGGSAVAGYKIGHNSGYDSGYATGRFEGLTEGVNRMRKLEAYNASKEQLGTVAEPSADPTTL